jgi:NAD(P)-dependent dehydrogenase (short-subunit alcohol dehydrogenase family)
MAISSAASACRTGVLNHAEMQQLAPQSSFGTQGYPRVSTCPRRLGRPVRRSPPFLFRSCPACRGEWAEPEEVAALFAFLASDEAPSITGAVYTIDNGLTVS